MRCSRIAFLLALLLWPGAAPAQSPPPGDVQRVQQIADTMVRLCIGGGRTEAITGVATGGADISLRSLDVKGNLTGEYKIAKSSAEGLVNGIDNAMSQVAADQADKVRACLEPVRKRILDVLLPAPNLSSPAQQTRPPIPLQDSEVYGRLQPANDPTPPNSCDRTGLPADAMKVLIGDNVLAKIGFGKFTALEVGMCDVFQWNGHAKESLSTRISSMGQTIRPEFGTMKLSP